MSQVPPPVLGFNNNVRHRGRVFHIQTEDSGVKIPRIVTHLFADGGHIIKTARTSYAEFVARPDLAQVVRQMMKEQHKAMFTALRRGELDPLLEAACGPLPLPPEPRSDAELPLSMPSSALPSASASSPPSSASGASRSSVSAVLVTETVNVEVARSRPPKSETSGSEAAAPTAVSSAPLSGAANGAGASDAPRTAGAQDPRRKPRTASAPSAEPRPSLGTAPNKAARSIFGDAVISEKSLDEVILSYLAEDLDGSD